MTIRFSLLWLAVTLLTVTCVVAPIAVAGEHEARLEELYDLRKPEGSGPFPAVVLVSGCSGFEAGRPRYDRVQSKLGEMGFVTIRVDYVGARNLKSCHPGYLAVTKDQVADDIFRALDRLTSTGFVKASSVNLLGWSYGGGSVLQALAKLDEHPNAQVTAVAAYYPSCRQVDLWSTSVPVLMLFGGADTVARPSICRDLIGGSTVATHVTTEEYENAYHAFDIEELPPKKEYQFGTIGYQPEAAEKAWKALEGFLVR